MYWNWSFSINFLKISRLCSNWIQRKMRWSRLTYICKNIISLILINFPKYSTFYVGMWNSLRIYWISIARQSLCSLQQKNGKLPPKSSLLSAIGGISKYITYSIQQHQFYACYFLIMINVRPLFHFPSLFFFFSNCKTESSFGNCRVWFYFLLHTIAFLDKG